MPTIKRIGFFMLGNLLYALALDMFFLDNNIAAGGFAGIATVINYLVPVSVGTVVFVMNLPFLVWAYIAKGWKYTLITATSTFVYSAMLNLVSFLPTVTDNLLLAAIFGGLLYGLGAVAMLKADASAGGTDLVARLLLMKFRNLSLGNMFLVVDGFTVVLAMIVFKNIELGLYAIIALYTCAVFTDKFITGFNYASICYVITKLQPQEMSGAIMSRLHRGVTWQRCVGMFEKNEKNVLMVVVKPKEMYKLKDIINEFDPSAFVVVAYANEVQGGGFQEER
ncbi:MAG: YitT family protein, partial [Oscillospiraceae bacterium]